MASFYPTVDPNPDFARLEEEILQFWRSEDVFARSVKNRPALKADGASNAYIFYDGPPFANGLPHYGHLLTGFVKDAIARYHAMQGRRVERRFGWDCHGLPAEMGAEKELGISGRAAIAQYGIGKFNEYCRTSVMKYTAEWEYYVTRQGRWVDFKHDYKTMDTAFMESVLWAFKQLYDKGLIYESMRVMPYSWAAETPVSNFETRIDNATRPREDKAIKVAFKLHGKPDGAPDAAHHYLVAWTTTPWTLPSNLALAVSANTQYVCVVKEDSCFIQAAWAPEIYPELTTQQQTTLQGGDLIGLTYEPLFPYFADAPGAFRVLDGSAFVTEGDGTGVVHMAPGFGEADYDVCKKNGIDVIVPVDEKGRFTSEIFDIPWHGTPHQNAARYDSPSEGELGGSRSHGRAEGLDAQNVDVALRLAGLVVVADTRLTLEQCAAQITEHDQAQHIAAKDVAKYGLANMRIVRWLKSRGKLVKDEPYTHNYPHCWRTDTPLIYRAMSSWYVAINTPVPALNGRSIKQVMAENNQHISWIPDHVRDGQMGKGIESAPDWSISRNRFWGTPIPIWKSALGKLYVAGSIEEIERLSGQKIVDLHRPYIDEVVLRIDGETYHRIEDVFDCWFESGSMPFAQLHYPFANKAQFEANFPADFITEYIAQTRGWFYTLQVLSAALFSCAPFRNVICHGVVIDEETGLKYSKRLKNYRDPKEVMDAYGADALRWMMLASPVMRGADLAVDPDGKFIRDVVRLNLKPLWSAYNFFTLYANADGVQAKRVLSSANTLDRYILSKAQAMAMRAQASLEAYDTPGATEAITAFLDLLNNWYIRRSRARFWAEEMTADKQAAYDTLFTVLDLVCRIAAPLLPFLTEAIYRGLHGAQTSVHLQDYLDDYTRHLEYDQAAVDDMDAVREACTAAHAIRSKHNIRTRQPLARLDYHGAGYGRVQKYIDLIRDEVNVKEVTADAGISRIAEFILKVNFPTVGKRLPAKMKDVIAAAKAGQYTKAPGGRLSIAGEELLPEEFTLLLQPKVKEGAQAVSTQDALVVLDLAITAELEAEGRARDLVRMIQQARKDAGLNVADRIALALDLPQDFASALQLHRDFIAAQTLAVSISAQAQQGMQTLTQELDGARVTIGIARAA